MTVLLDIEFLADSSFSFSAWNISTYCHLDSKGSNKKSVSDLTGDPLHVMSYSFLLFSRFSLYVWHLMCLGVGL